MKASSGRTGTLCENSAIFRKVFSSSNPRHAPAPEPDVCSPTAPGAGWDAELPPTWRPSPRPHPENRSAWLFPLSVDRTCQDPKSIAPKFQTTSFKSLYQKRSGERDACVSPKLIAPERFRYSTKTFRSQARLVPWHAAKIASGAQPSHHQTL